MGTSNPDQTDSDSDGTGDPCDYTPVQDCNLESSGGVGGTDETLSDLTVGAGYNPTFSWTGDNVANLTVTSETTSSETVWRISTTGENGISSPVKYGTVSNNAEEHIKTESVLTIGVTYKISIRKSTGLNLYSTFMPQGETVCPLVIGSGGGSGGESDSNNPNLVGTWKLIEVQEGGNTTNVHSDLGEILIFTSASWTFSGSNCWTNGSYQTDDLTITYTLPASSSTSGGGYCYAIDTLGEKIIDSYVVNLNTLIITKSNSDYYKFQRL